MRALVVQGDWLLRKAHYKNLGMNVYHGPERLPCGGYVGFIDTVRNAIADHLVDKVVVVWNGQFDGWDKYHHVPVLRAKKEKTWNQRLRLSGGRPTGMTKREEHEFHIGQQREKLRKNLDQLNIRELCEERSESMDAIALYVKSAVPVGEEIIILGRDHEFFQLIQEHVSILRYDGVKVTNKNFFELYGYSHTNDLMLKCLIGMPDKVVSGIKNVKLKSMLHYFTGLKLDHYPYRSLIEYARKKRADTRLLFYDTILGANDLVHRNARLINMNDPIININLTHQTNCCLYSPLKEGRVEELIDRYERENYKAHVQDDLRNYFEPFQRVLLKEKEYSLFNEQINI